MSIEANGWDEIVRLCRRICALRERGDAAAAEELRSTALTPVVAAIRTIGSLSAAEIDARVAAIFVSEHDRVANAALIAEFLAPLLRDSDDHGVQPVATPAPRPGRREHGESVSEPRRPPTDIADFIDEMIAQDPASRPARRAS